MPIYTTRSRIKDLLVQWKERYEQGEWGPEKIAILRRLEALDVETVTKEEVDAIVGNSSWTHTTCDLCKQDRGAVLSLESDQPVTTISLGERHVRVGGKHTYAWICFLCVHARLSDVYTYVLARMTKLD